MEVSLQNIGKRFQYEWIFRDVDFHFRSGGRYAILGSNGSGKSTLMKVLSGHLSPSKGRLVYKSEGQEMKQEDISQYISYAAPYIELIEEFTLKESIHFHTQFRPLVDGISRKDLLDLLGFAKVNEEKQVKFFSSGMKQRLKLILTLAAQSQLILLDEPTTNLDQQGMDWYLRLIDRFAGKRTIIVATNEERDYTFCEESLNILDFKSQVTKP